MYNNDYHVDLSKNYSWYLPYYLLNISFGIWLCQSRICEVNVKGSFERLRRIKAFPDVLNCRSCSCKYCLFCVHHLVVVECRCGLWKYIHNICVNVIPGGTEVIFQCGHQAPREGILHRGDRTPTREMWIRLEWISDFASNWIFKSTGLRLSLNMRCLFEEARKT